MTKEITEKDITTIFNTMDDNTGEINKLLEQEITDGVDNTDAVMELVRTNYQLIRNIYHRS